MRNLTYLFVFLFLLSCDDSDGPEVVICPPTSSTVYALMVDCTTNDFLGGYTIPVFNYGQPFEMVCDYKSPSDFGSITWYEKSTKIKLFAGTIVWMGAGEQTYPEKNLPTTAFPKLDITTAMPDIVSIDPEDYDGENTDFQPIWKAVEDLQCVSWVKADTPVYAYQYARSVGAGNPAQWYWILFLKYK